MKKFFIALLSVGTLVSLIRKSFKKSDPEEEEKLFERGEKEPKEELNEHIERVDINQASVEGFEQVPGIGEDLASKILDFREENGEFKSIEDLVNVTGIGEKKLNAIREFITLK